MRVACITALIGSLLVSFVPLENLSFDVATNLQPTQSITNVALITIDDDTLKLGSEGNKLVRTNYIRLLDTLAQQQAGLVFMDIAFDETNTVKNVDEQFAKAIAQYKPGVVLIAGMEDTVVGGSKLIHVKEPIPLLANATQLPWGHAELFYNDAVRKISPSFKDHPYAVWVAATNLHAKVQPNSTNDDRFLNFYGAEGSAAFATYSFQNVVSTNFRNNLLAHKIVLIGQKIATPTVGERKDTFATPYSQWGGAPWPGVAIHATALMNLVNGEWVRPVPLLWQWIIAVIWSIGAVLLFHRLSNKGKTTELILATTLVIGVCAASLFVQWRMHWAWAWLGVAFIQTPLSLLLVLRQPRLEKYLAFISYRTEEDGAAALLIQRTLAERGLKVFLDVRSLHAGKFDDQLLTEITNATFFIIILSPNSLARCVNDGDWVLRELTHALAQGKQIIPVLKNNFSFDDHANVPDLPAIAELRRYQGVKYSSADFDGFMQKLRTLLARR